MTKEWLSFTVKDNCHQTNLPVSCNTYTYVFTLRSFEYVCVA